MTKRRSEPRHHTEPIEISSPTLRGQVLNLSMDGMAIETSKPLKPGETVSLKVDGEGDVVLGKVRWSKLKSIRVKDAGDSEAVYHAGLSIERETESPDDESS